MKFSRGIPPWGAPPGIAAEEPEVQVSLMQGDICFSAEPKILVTVLGSCVAVCLWDKVRGIGGMNHFVLPSDPNGEKSTRYGDVSIDELEAGLLRLGCRMADLQAKVFGGAAVLPFGGGQTVGSNNVQLALDRSGSRRNARAVRLASRSGFTPGPAKRSSATFRRAFAARSRQRPSICWPDERSSEGVFAGLKQEVFQFGHHGGWPGERSFG
jgi:chemotaxis receptor (MCP) glutamine deamidase CheD